MIVESEEVWDKVRSSYVVANGGTWHADSSRHMMGLSTEEWVAYLVEDLGVRRPKQEVAAEVIASMASNYASNLPLIEGAADAVRNLATRWRLAIASGSPARLIEAVLRGASIRDCIDAYVSSDEVRAGKPQPDVYLEAAHRLDIDPRDCAVVEDSTNGIKAAHAAGALVIAIPSRPYPPDQSTLRLADVVLPDIRQLTPDVVSGLGR